MSNYLSNFNNIYANLSQSAYPNSPKAFPIETLSGDKRNAINSGNSIKINYSTPGIASNGAITQGGQVLVGPPEAGYQGLSKGGVVYLQLDDMMEKIA